MIRNLCLAFYSKPSELAPMQPIFLANQPSLLGVSQILEKGTLLALYFSFCFISFSFVRTFIIKFTCPYPGGNYWSRSYYNCLRSLLACLMFGSGVSSFILKHLSFSFQSDSDMCCSPLQTKERTSHTA